MRRLTLALTVFVLPASADTDPASVTLSPIMETVMAGGMQMAATQLVVVFERYSEDGERVVLSNIGTRAKLDLAERRANKVYGYLSADLNWDGIVTRDELETVFASPEKAPFVDGYLTDGDLDGDGTITVAEMMEDAMAENPETDMVGNGYLREMVTWDLNGDGILHFNEVLNVINAHQK